MDDDVLAYVEASPLRRWLGITMLGSLGGLSIYIALAQPPELAWQAFLLAFGLGSVWMAERMWRATHHRIELTREELRDTSGAVIAQVADITSMDRGFLAFKPSNGFLLRLSASQGRVWRPGLWWRMGRRVGVGGVAPGNQTRMMSDMLAMMLAERGD